MPDMTPAAPKEVWPPREKPPQLTLEQVRRLDPDSINRARAAGALEDVMLGKDGA
jgi:hypothetical protein